MYKSESKPRVSSSALQDEDLSEIDFECAICHNEFDSSDHRPEVYSCMHPFCAECIEHMLQKAKEVEVSPKFSFSC